MLWLFIGTDLESIEVEDYDYVLNKTTDALYNQLVYLSWWGCRDFNVKYLLSFDKFGSLLLRVIRAIHVFLAAFSVQIE